MKKVLGILLALTITVGAFAGLTLLSVSAASRSALVNGEYLFEDFENNSAAYFNTPLGGSIALAKKAEGAPTYGDSDYSLKFSGGDGAWKTPGITKENVKAVVNKQPGTYVLSAWVYFETMPTGSTEMTATWRNASTNQSFTCGKKTIEQGKWMFMSFMTTLNETWAQDEDLYVMFDGIGNGSVFYIDNVTLAKVEDTFVATWYYNNAGAAFIGSGNGGFTGENIPAADNKVSFTLYNLNDIDVTAQIELRASDWSTKTVSGAKQNLLPIPAHGNATIELDVSAGYDATDFWIIYMKTGSNNLSGEEYIFGIELSGAADMTMFQKAQNKAVDDYYPVVGRITNSDSKKGSVNAAFGNTIVYGIQNAIEAVPVDGCSFDGWYSGGSKVSSDAQYAIDTTDILGVPEALEAQFSGTPTPLALGDGTLENSDAGWTYFAAAGKGTITRVDGGANNTAKAIQYVPGSGNQWGALAFDVGPAIINDADNRYAGSGAAKYKLTFYARLAEDAAVDSGEFHIFLNSQYHKNAGELAGIYGGTAADYVSTYTNYTSQKMITFTKQWQKFEIEMDVSEQYVSQMQMLYAKGVTNAYQLMIRFDGSEGIYTEAGNQNSGYLIDELSFEKMPDPTPTPTPTGTEPTPTPTSDNTKKVENGDAENGLTGWDKFTAGGGTVSVVEGGANGTGHAVRFNPTAQWDSIAFDLGPAIVQNEEAGYKGSGAGTYTIKFWAKIDGTVPKNTNYKVVLNSQIHANKQEIASKFEIADQDWFTDTFITGPTVTLTGEWQQYSAAITVTEEFLKTLDAIYASGEKGARAYELILRMDGGAEGMAYANTKTYAAYLIDEVTIEAAAETPKEPVGVKWTFDKDFTDSAYFCSTAAKGFITDADVKDGKVKKSFTIYNTGSEDIQVQFSASVLHNGTPQSWEAIKNTEKTVIPAGKSLLITYECDAKVTIDAKGLKAEYTYDQFFPRIDITNKDGEGKITAGTEFIVAGINVAILEKLDTNAKDSVTRTVVYELPTSGGSNNGDLLPVALITAVVAAAVTLAVVVAKKKKEQE